MHAPSLASWQIWPHSCCLALPFTDQQAAPKLLELGLDAAIPELLASGVAPAVRGSLLDASGTRRTAYQRMIRAAESQVCPIAPQQYAAPLPASPARHCQQ